MNILYNVFIFIFIIVKTNSALCTSLGIMYFCICLIFDKHPFLLENDNLETALCEYSNHTYLKL